MSVRFRTNNFDLIRAFAAAQVVIMHASSHMQINIGPVGTLLSLMPGVPIFFFVSGFLISKSYENNPRVREYSLNRVLRIYPALIICTVVTIASDCLVNYLPDAAAGVGLGKLAMWIIGQVTVVQFYNPEFMRRFGSGVLNGSLWTVTVELQFYVLVPLLYHMASRLSNTRIQWNVFLLTTMIAFLAANATYNALSVERLSWLEDRLVEATTATGYGFRTNLATKLLGVTFIPWFYMFLAGVLAQRNFEFVSRILAGKAILLLSVYVAASYVGVNFLGLNSGNAIDPVMFLLLAATVFSCAYSAPGLALRLLRGNDISYGLYIYHMPVINILLFYGLSSEPRYLLLAVIVTIVAATLSWFLVERPSLRLKRHPFFARIAPAT